MVQRSDNPSKRPPEEAQAHGGIPGREERKAQRKRESTGRAKTGFIFALAVIACVVASEISTVVLVAVLAAFCSVEVCELLRFDSKIPNQWIGVTFAVLYPLIYVWMGIFGFVLLTMILVGSVLAWYVFYHRARITDVAVTVFSAVYPGLMLSSLVMIRMSVPGIWGGVLTLVVIFSVWANDTMAYVWGSRLGRHRMAPRISPKKSWEGCVAGLVGSVVIWMLMPFIPGVHLSYLASVLSAVVVGLFSVLGDLAESRLKRAAGKKDSGKLLPGHGGFLDRCDALILGSAASAICLTLCGVITII